MKTQPDSSYNKVPVFFRVAILLVILNGLLYIVGTLFVQFSFRHLRHPVLDLSISLQLVAGLILFYLATLLAHRKRTALFFAIPFYMFMIGVNFIQFLRTISSGTYVNLHHFLSMGTFRGVFLPIIIIGLLLYYKDQFIVKSDLQNFAQNLRYVILVLLITFAYGVTGYMLMDVHDFHKEITFTSAVHHTIDQFDLTTNSLHPYTRRARVFSDSLSVISIGAVVYTLISFFQPLRSRFHDQQAEREHMASLLAKASLSSEDFFKIWPHDKQYYFNEGGTAGLALGVKRGVALVVGDPVGDKDLHNDLLNSFQELCFGNDWLPAFIHTEPDFSNLYSSHGFNIQKIGEEAIVDISHAQSNVATNKYFRNIKNKFNKNGFQVEVCMPPHNPALVERLQTISSEWLKLPGRTERGFMMGSFSDDYMQQCTVLVVRDAAGTIQAFINQIPTFNTREANFDLLRHSHKSPSNINDFLLLNFISYLESNGYHKLNLGLTPLAGLDKEEENHSLIDNALRFAYANGDRLYSFSGLRKFKEKYEPEWSPRYIVYKGGIRNFTKVLTALNVAMKIKSKN